MFPRGDAWSINRTHHVIKLFVNSHTCKYSVILTCVLLRTFLQDRRGETALSCAIEQRNAQLVQLLLETGKCKVDIRVREHSWVSTARKYLLFIISYFGRITVCLSTVCHKCLRARARVCVCVFKRYKKLLLLLLLLL